LRSALTVPTRPYVRIMPTSVSLKIALNVLPCSIEPKSANKLARRWNSVESL